MAADTSVFDDLARRGARWLAFLARVAQDARPAPGEEAAVGAAPQEEEET